jgi:hypothetical protein
MQALFPVWANTVVRAALFIGATSAVGIPVWFMVYVRTPYNNDELKPLDQPVEFDHRHHANDDGLDCRYCHSNAEKSQYAGIPPTSLCMNCHAQIWSSASLFDPVRKSYYNDTPITWQRVYRLPDFVFFNHAVHVRRGVGCRSCHGRVDQMARVYRVAPLTMGWCLDCHRHPEAHLVPVDRVTDMTYEPDRPPDIIGREIKEALHIDPPTTCSGCHR